MGRKSGIFASQSGPSAVSSDPTQPTGSHNSRLVSPSGPSAVSRTGPPAHLGPCLVSPSGPSAVSFCPIEAAQAVSRVSKWAIGGFVRAEAAHLGRVSCLRVGQRRVSHVSESTSHI